MALQVYSTLTRKKEPFHKKPGDTVTMYVCGPTVYKPSHIGHMVGPVIFDTVKRYLTYLGYKVKWVVNITDVDDKLIKRAGELNTTVPELAARMTEDYFACLQALNVTGIDHFPKATDHIDGMIDVIKTLIQKDYAYEVNDGVYFDVSKDKDYGALSNRDPEQMEAGARLEPNPKKRNPGDFALWKSKPGEPEEVQFASPFKCGRGRPGWHIECTCMAIKELGETLDIHGGGLDLLFPHHENELAQSESLTDKPFARFWMHNGLLKMGSAKMAGSVGNVVNIADLLQRHTADTIRFLLLSSQYRSPIEYSEERLEEVERSLHKFYDLFDKSNHIEPAKWFYELFENSSQTAISVEGPHAEFLQDIANTESAFHGYMDDDFNTAGAVSCLFDMATSLNRFAAEEGLQAIVDEGRSAEFGPRFDAFLVGIQKLRDLSDILGLFSTVPEVPLAREQLIPGVKQLLATLDHVRFNFVEGLAEAALPKSDHLRVYVEALIALRRDARQSKNFALSDRVRKELGELGVTLEDRPGGTTWRVG